MGFDSLPDQLVSKSVTQGFSFNILCVGKCVVAWPGGSLRQRADEGLLGDGRCCPGHLLSCKGTSQAESHFGGSE